MKKKKACPIELYMNITQQIHLDSDQLEWETCTIFSCFKSDMFPNPRNIHIHTD